jgi:hypothetical protein
VTLCVAANTTGPVNATRDHKDLLEVLKRHPMVEDLVCHPILYRDDNNRNIGSVLSPHKGILMETVELRNEEGRSLLLLRDSVLGSESTTTPRDPTKTCTETGHIPPCSHSGGQSHGHGDPEIRGKFYSDTLSSPRHL